MAKELPTSKEYHGYGNTCPLLKIAKQYEVPYDLPLAYADRYQHGRELSEHIIGIIKSLSRSRCESVERAARWVSCHTMDVRAGLAKL